MLLKKTTTVSTNYTKCLGRNTAHTHTYYWTVNWPADGDEVISLHRYVPERRLFLDITHGHRWLHTAGLHPAEGGERGKRREGDSPVIAGLLPVRKHCSSSFAPGCYRMLSLEDSSYGHSDTRNTPVLVLLWRTWSSLSLSLPPSFTSSWRHCLLTCDDKSTSSSKCILIHDYALYLPVKLSQLGLLAICSTPVLINRITKCVNELNSIGKR